MKLFILRPKESSELWEPWYDKAFGFVVRAKDESAAREIAANRAGAESSGAWLSKKESSCKELTPKGKAEVILRDLASA